MQQQIDALTQQLGQLAAEVRQSRNPRGVYIEQYEPVQPGITQASQINIQIFKEISPFDGNPDEYGPWRSVITGLMKPLEPFLNSKEYYDVLCLIRYTKIKGAALCLLKNHNTPLNLKAILNRLDYNYADSKSYISIMEEMKKCRQGKTSLSEFHSRISQLINQALTKCEIDYPNSYEGLQENTKEIARICFKNGLRDKFTQHTLYQYRSTDLETAYAIAADIEYQKQNNEEETPMYNQRVERREYNTYKPAVQYARRNVGGGPPEPMDVDRSHKNYRYENTNHSNYNNPQRNTYNQQQNYRNNFDRQRAGLQPMNFQRGEPTKRDHQPSSRNFNPNKIQRINQVTDNNDQDSLEVNLDDKEYELQGTFLEE